MAQLAERDQFEQQAFRRLRNLSARHRKEIEAYLGDPPNLRNVPPSFWDRVEQETNAELAAILIIIMMASAIQEGVPADFASVQSGGWGRIRAQFAARRMMQTTVKQLNAVQEVWNAEIGSGKKIGITRIRADLMKVLGPERMGTVAITETTKAASAGTLLAAGRGSAAVASQFKVIWRLGACEHCKFCERMAGTDQRYWSRYSDGPPAHVGCCCGLDIVPMDAPSRMPDFDDSPGTSGTFESDHQTCRAMVDLLVMETVRNEGGEWVLYTLDGSKVLGRHKSEADAFKQEAAIRASQHMEESVAGPVIEGFSESDHPRGDDGRFVSSGDITAAIGDLSKEQALRDRVTDPKERAKLERDLKAAGGKSDKPSVKIDGAFKPPLSQDELDNLAASVVKRAVTWTPGNVRVTEPAIGADGKKRRRSLQKVNALGDVIVDGKEFAIDKDQNVYSRKRVDLMSDAVPDVYRLDNEAKPRVESAIKDDFIDNRKFFDQQNRKFDTPSVDLAHDVAKLGLGSRLSIPDDSTSRYVFAQLPAGGEFKIRLADHPQPKDFVDGKLQTVGGFDTSKGKRHSSSDISIDPESGLTTDDAIKALKAKISSGEKGRVHESLQELLGQDVLIEHGPHVVESFNESDHPRDDNGRFVSKGAIILAAGNPAKEQALRDSVTDPKEREKLDRDLKAAGGGIASTKAFTDGGRSETGQGDAVPRRDAPSDAAPRHETPRSQERVTVSKPRKITETKGINSSYVVDLEGDKRGVYKPAAGIANIADHGWDPEMWHPQTMHKSEVAASVLDEMMGLGMVPKTRLTDGEQGIGSVQEWSNARAAVQDEMINYGILDNVSEAGRTKLAAFDLLIGNPDRHYANVLADGDKPVAIDNGMGFPKHNEPYREGKYALKGVWPPDFYSQKLPQDFQDSLGKLLSDRETVTRELKPFLEDDQLQAFWKRAEVLHKHSDNFRKIAPPHDKFTGNAFDGGRALEEAKVETSDRVLFEAFSESEHPRGDNGRFISKDSIRLAIGNPKKEKALRDSVTNPDERKKLEAEIEKQKSFAPKGSFEKPKAKRMQLTEAKKVGEGKDAKIVLADGSDAPEHVQKIAGKIPPAWEDIKVSLDPNSDVLATGSMVNRKTGKTDAKTVYNAETWEMKVAALKFSRVNEGIRVQPIMEGEIAAARKHAATRDVADLSMLIMAQGTRPGSDEDTKGYERLYGHKMTAENVRITPAGTVETVSRKQKDGSVKEKQSTLKNDRVELVVGGEVIPLRDKKAAAEITRRVNAKESLHDSSYWLKSHGATTLEARHVVVDGNKVNLEFMGKESVWHSHEVTDPQVAKMLIARKAAAKKPDGRLFDASEGKLNDFVKDLDGGHFTSKDFRTMKGTSMAIDEVKKRQVPKTPDEYKKAVMDVAGVVSGKLGNEAAQALESYIDPTIFHAWRQASGS